MFTREKIITACSAYGPIFLGIILLFAGSTIFGSTSRPTYHSFPVAGVRSTKAVGGDIAVPAFPQALPTVPLLKNASSTFGGSLTAPAVIVVDDATGVVMYDKNAETIRPLASISKLMSALVLLDLPVNWASTTVITNDDWDGESHSVQVGEKYTLEDLWHIALIGSSNTAVNALVRNSTVTTTEFMARMNKKAAELHLSSAFFVEPTGLNSANVANPADTALLLKEALRRDKIFKALQIPEYYARPLSSSKPRRIWSTDLLLTKWIPSDFETDSIVGKTGFINDSLYNFAVRLTDGRGHAVRVVVMGAATNDARFTEARDVAMWVFKNYLWPNESGYELLAE